MKMYVHQCACFVFGFPKFNVEINFFAMEHTLADFISLNTHPNIYEYVFFVSLKDERTKRNKQHTFEFYTLCYFISLTRNMFVMYTHVCKKKII